MSRQDPQSVCVQHVRIIIIVTPASTACIAAVTAVVITVGIAPVLACLADATGDAARVLARVESASDRS